MCCKANSSHQVVQLLSVEECLERKESRPQLAEEVRKGESNHGRTDGSILYKTV